MIAGPGGPSRPSRFDPRAFLGQLKRRRVIRVAGVYVVGAFALLQGLNAILDMAGAPAWVGQLLLGLIVLGFLAAIALAWVFDVTPDGIVRTPPEPARSEAHHPLEVREGAAAAVRLRRYGGRVAAAAAIGALAVTMLVWFTRTRGDDVALDPDAVLVLPFHVAADPSLGYLHEGMVELLAASLNGETGSRAVDPRTALAAWRRAVEPNGNELTPDRALEVARGVRAGGLLLGSVVGTPAQLTLSAELYDVARSDVRRRISASGPADSLTALVDGLVAQFLVHDAGVPRHQLDDLTTASLPALRVYLDGMRNYRRGRFGDAAAQLEEALQQDSTFALAGIYLALASGWGDLTGEPGARQRGMELAWAARDRLSHPDRLLLEALSGPNFPDPSSPREVRRAGEIALDASPDRLEAIMLLGAAHRGGVVHPGEERALERAEELFRRALALDSTFAPALYHVVNLAAVKGDATTVDRLVPKLLAADSTSELAQFQRWMAAAVSGDEGRIMDIRAAMPHMHATALGWIAYSAMNLGIDMDGAEAALAAMRAGARSRRERTNYEFRMEEFLANRGRLREYEEHSVTSGHHAWWGLVGEPVQWETVVPGMDAVWWEPIVRAYVRVYSVLYYGAADTTGIEAAIAELEALYRDPPAGSDPIRLFSPCVAGTARSALGEPSSGRAALAVLKARMAEDRQLPPTIRRNLDRCAATMEAMIALHEGRPDARALAERADSLLWADFVSRFVRNRNQLMLARVFDELGDPEAALRIIRRRELVNPAFFLATILAEEGRLAARTGDREGAIRAFRHYLALRTEPDPELEPEVREVAEMLAELTGER